MQSLEGTSKNAFHGIFIHGKAKTCFLPFGRAPLFSEVPLSSPPLLQLAA